MQATLARLRHLPSQQPFVLALAAAVWLALYRSLIPVSEMLVAALPVVRDSQASCERRLLQWWRQVLLRG